MAKTSLQPWERKLSPEIRSRIEAGRTRDLKDRLRATSNVMASTAYAFLETAKEDRKLFELLANHFHGDPYYMSKERAWHAASHVMQALRAEAKKLMKHATYASSMARGAERKLSKLGARQ
jgi:uncharacterized protein with ATP-grasp and redox domains